MDKNLIRFWLGTLDIGVGQNTLITVFTDGYCFHF